jgi:hypothetical protein
MKPLAGEVSIVRLGFLALLALGLGGQSRAAEPLPRFERVVIDANLPGAYQVEVADVNGDGRPDVVALGGGTCAWYENPRWTKRVITGPKQTPGVISSATADLDGDGKAEVAIAHDFSMNVPTRGKLLLARQGRTPDDPWTIEPIAAIGSIHRLRFGPVLLGAKRALVVAPIFGPSATPPVFSQEPAHLGYLEVSASGTLATGPHGKLHPIGDAPVLHAIDVVDVDGDGTPEVLGASNLGVTLFACTGDATAAGGLRFEPRPLAAGAPGEAPRKGASEIHAGRLKDGRRFLATVEPWHGTEVAVYFSESLRPLKFGPRNVIDSTLKEGHALWVADVDGDGDDEVFAGYRGAGTSLLGFDFDGERWTRTVIDPAIAAQDLRGGDLDGDGTPDVVAVGGKTRNVVWYRPRKD